MKILIIGAGGQGSACASILNRQDQIEDIRIVDMDEGASRYVVDKLGSKKIKAGTADATNSDDVAKAAEGADVVVDVTMPWMATHVMKGALKANAQYVNIAFDTPYWDELFAKKPVEDLTLCKEFREAGLTALLGCGFAPGMTNIIARRLANKLDRVDSIKIKVGKVNKTPGEAPYDWAFRQWNPGWSPKQALIDYTNPAYALENGEFVRYEPFEGIEMCEFPEPVGTLPIAHHSHEEVYSMPATFEGVKNVDLKYFFPYQAAVFYTAGLCSRDKIQVGDAEVVPLDVVTALMPSPQESSLDLTDEQLEAMDKTAFTEDIIEVAGKQGDETVTWKANCPTMNTPALLLKKLFGTANVYAALPLSIGTLMLGCEEQKKGIIFADDLDTNEFLRKMLDTGYPYKWTETCER